MKNKHSITILLLIFTIVFVLLNVTGCSKEVAARDTVVRGGRLYLRGGDEAFTGFVLGKSREGYRTQTCTFKKEYKDGLLDGMTYFYYPNGKIESKVPYEKGEINGYFMRYWENGKPRARIHFLNGMRGGAKGEMYWDNEGNKKRS